MTGGRRGARPKGALTGAQGPSDSAQAPGAQFKTAWSTRQLGPRRTSGRDAPNASSECAFAHLTANSTAPKANRCPHDAAYKQRNAGRGTSRAHPACALQTLTSLDFALPGRHDHTGRIAEHHDAHRAAGRSGSLSREIQITTYFAAGAGWAEARLRPPLPVAFFPCAAAAGPLAFLRALRLACSAAFASPA